MHARNGNPVLQPHQLGQHLRALDYWDLPPPCFHHLGIALIHRRAGDDHTRSDNIGRSVALENRRPQRRQPFGNRRTPQVRSANRVAQVEQYLGDAAYADPANAYEVNSLWFQKHEFV